MQIALAATLLLAVVWFVALRPRSSAGGSAPAPAAQAPAAPASSGGGAAPGVAGLKTAIDKAHGAVSTASADAQRAASSSADGAAPAAGSPAHVGSRPATPGAAPAPAASAARPHPKPHAAAPKHHHGGAHGPLRVVLAALHAHKALAIAFLDLSSADSRAVAQELRHVSNFGGRAVVLSLPLAQLSDYDFITNKVQVTVAPTVVIVDRRASATTIVGFTDRGEIEQRLADALAVKPAR